MKWYMTGLITGLGIETEVPSLVSHTLGHATSAAELKFEINLLEANGNEVMYPDAGGKKEHCPSWQNARPVIEVFKVQRHFKLCYLFI